MKSRREMRGTGNQHKSLRGDLLVILHTARGALKDGQFRLARAALDYFRRLHAQAPASTRRRWKCGR